MAAAKPSAGSKDLQAELAALEAQREKDIARLRELVLERDRLRFALAERNAEEVESPAGSCNRNAAGDEIPEIDGWLLKSAAVRAELRREPANRSLVGRLLAAVALRFARRAARQRSYATAEVFYQAILLLAPRPFIWRQTGNMLAGQGLYAAAVDCFDRAIEADAYDAEAWHAKGVALRRSGEREAGTEAVLHAIQLDPALASRDQG